MEAGEPSRDEAQLRLDELGEQLADVRRREKVEMRRVVLRMAPDQEAQPVLEPESIRRRTDERAARTQHPVRLVDQQLRLADVLEHLADHDDVERRVHERERVVEVGPERLDPEPPLGDLERLAVDVDACDLVALRVVLRERAVAAAEVEDAAAGPADELAEERRPLRLGPDEVGRTGVPMMLPVALLEVLQGASLYAGLESALVTTVADPEAPPEQDRPRGSSDIRATRTSFLARPPLRTLLRRLASIAALLTIDVCGLALGLYLALVLRWLYYERELPLWGVPWEAGEQWLPFLTLITILVFWQAGLYAEREHRAGVGRVVSSLVLVAVVTVVFAWGVDHQFGTYGLAPTAVIACAAIISVLRASYERLTRDLMHALGVRRRAVLVGRGQNVEHLLRTLGETRGGIDYSFVGAISPTQDGTPIPRLGSLDDLGSVLEGRRVDELIVNGGDVSDEQLVELVEQAHQRGVQVRVAPTTAEILTQRAEYVPGQAVPLFELRPPVFAGVDWATKRLFDLAVATAVAILGLPIWLLIAVAIKLDSRGPVLYRDRRIGLGEREFGMIKFRTMHASAKHLQDSLETRNEASGPLFKIRDDPRVTRVGALLRALSLDEVPQSLNVLRGEMSLVGPRPLPIRDYHLLEPWHRKRYLVLPGITGLWQISGRSELTFDDLVRLDFYYLENWSIWLDVTILLKTIPAVFGRKGAY